MSQGTGMEKEKEKMGEMAEQRVDPGFGDGDADDNVAEALAEVEGTVGALEEIDDLVEETDLAEDDAEATAADRKAESEMSGGASVLADGEINIARFDIGPAEEFRVNWWNKEMIWEVRREPSNHQVVVAESTRNIWKVHMAVAGAVLGVFTLLAVLLFGLPLGYAIAIDVVLVLLVWGLLRFEQRLMGETNFIMGEITTLDSTIWEGIKIQMAKMSAQTVANQKKRYNEAVKEAKKAHGEAVKSAKKNGGTDPGKFVGPDVDDYIYSGDAAITETKVADKMREYLSEKSLEKLNGALVDRYLGNPELSKSMGWGVKGCECVACAVNSELGIVPKLSGISVARKLRERRVQEGKVELSRAEKAARQKELERKEKAREASRRDLERRRAARAAEEEKRIKARADQMAAAAMREAKQAGKAPKAAKGGEK